MIVQYFKLSLFKVLIYLIFTQTLLNAQTDTTRFNPQIAQLLEKVSRANLKNYIATLADANGQESRVSYTEGNRWAANYLKETLTSFSGLTTVEFDTFFVNGATPPFNNLPLVNVVATLQGMEEPEKLIIVGGHLDDTASLDTSIDWSNDWAQAKARGADDNASGLAAILEIARILSDPENGFTSRYTIKFVAFGAEEFHPVYEGQHHLGSRHFVVNLFKQNARVVGAYIIDMVGFNDTGNLYFNIVANTSSQGLGEKMLEINDVYQIGLTANSPPFPDPTYSDHESFWLYRYPAILLIENAPPWQDNLPWYRRNPVYHTQNDTVDLVNMDQVEKITKLALATVATVASPVTSVLSSSQNASSGFALPQNFPNPFNSDTVIYYRLEQAGRVRLTIYDLLGKEIKTLVEEIMPAGDHQIRWDGRNELGQAVPSGIYFFQIFRGNQRLAGKMVLIR